MSGRTPRRVGLAATILWLLPTTSHAHLVNTGLGPFYGRRGDALADAVEASLGERVCFDRPDGGMFLWVRLVDSPVPARDLLAIAVDAGVAFVPGEAFHVDGSGHDHVRLENRVRAERERADRQGCARSRRRRS